jgi:hypothetical protein
MSISSRVVSQHERQSSTTTPRLTDSPAVLDVEQLEQWLWKAPESAPVSLTVSFDEDLSQQSIVAGREPSTSSPSSHSYQADYVVMTAVFVIIIFLWMQ